MGSLPLHRVAPRLSVRGWPLIALAMALHFALLCVLKVSRGIEGEILWVSHAGLALGSVGILLGSSMLVATAFTAVAGLHALWLFDAAAGFLFGSFPLGFTSYLAEADLPTLLGTSHHLFLAPILLVWLRRCGQTPRESFWVAAGLVLCLTLLCRFIIPPGMNVNFAHAVLPTSDLPAFRWFNAETTPMYLSIHFMVTLAMFLIPASMLAELIAGPESKSSSRAHAATELTPMKPWRLVVPRNARAFTLIELIAVMIVLAVLAGVAVPRYIDYTARARQAADEGSLGGIRSALSSAYINHRVTNAAPAQYITSVNQIAGLMENGSLPQGITINGSQLQDSRGNLYDLTAETQTAPGGLVLDTPGGWS